MAISRLIAGGLRGLSTEQVVPFALPDGRPGSGITILVGTNNAGKSTVIEALKAVSHNARPSFTEGKRNHSFGDQVQLRIEMDNGSFREIKSVRPSSSQTIQVDGSTPSADVFVVPSRRSFDAFFSTSTHEFSRDQYSQGLDLPALRIPTLPNFSFRLLEMERDESKRAAFDELLMQVLGHTPNWTIDQNDSGNSYLKFIWKTAEGSQRTHSSDGLGEGMTSLFVILDALRDSSPGSTLIFDEPELSLHPQFQRRLRSLLSKYAEDRQVIYATHSPYFIDWADVSNGAIVNRIFKTANGTTVATPSREALTNFIKLGKSNIYNPHMLGLETNEVFLLEGGIVLTEGQEDVVMLPRVLFELEFPLPASFFGWGVGGATNMGTVCQLLLELGYESVVGIFDNDQLAFKREIQERYPKYHFECIPADDVRPKEARKSTTKKAGLVNEEGRVRPEYVDSMRELLERSKEYFMRETSAQEIL